jgi:Fe-S oxidoreductase
LGVDEKCCGDFARRVGDEGLFQKLARENIETLKRFDFDFILTHCPHCFNTLANEYPGFGADFEVVHHTSLILRLIEQEAISLHPAEGRVIFHDPCYLGRHNRIYEPPRRILGQIFSELHEFPQARQAAFCCGAGGGHMWKQEEMGEKISLMRMDEALALRPSHLATACPFCLLMFQEAKQMSPGSDELLIKDLAQIVERQLA